MKEERIADLVRGAVAIGPLEGALEDVLANPTTDSQGEPAISVTLVVAEKVLSALSGDDAVDLLMAIQDRLEEAGEERFPIVGYATPEDVRQELSGDHGAEQDD